MNSLIIDIRQTSLRAAFSTDGIIGYCRTFEFSPGQDNEEEQSGGGYIPARDNPYLVYYDLKDGGTAKDAELKEIVKTIRKEVNGEIDAIHLIIPFTDAAVETHKLPKLPRPDIEKLISRKISTEAKEEFPSFSIIPGEADAKTQTWFSIHVPATTIRGYRRLFANNRMRITSLTTPINAMLDAFKGVREAIFNSHAVFEIQRGIIEAYYISAEGMLHCERMPCYNAESAAPTEESDKERLSKQRLFKIIDTIFRINSNYQKIAPKIPVQMAWLCGDEPGLDEIASAVKEAMAIEVGIAPAIPTGLTDESAYVPLAGFASSLHNGTATLYTLPGLLRRFPLRRTSGIAIYTLTSIAALAAYATTEMSYKKLLKSLPRASAIAANDKKDAAKQAITVNLESIKKITNAQYPLYNVFQYFGNNLPEGVYLEHLEFQQKEQIGQIALVVLAPLDGKRKPQQLLENINLTLDNSTVLKQCREPVVSYAGSDKTRQMKISVTCEVNSLDAKN